VWEYAKGGKWVGGSFKYFEFPQKDGMFPMTSLKGKEMGNV